MKAITLWQPWASLIACGAKRYETRSWVTNYRGPIAIHAGVRDGADLLSSPQINALMRAFANTPYQVKNPGRGGYDYIYPYGAVVATAELVGCYEIFADEFEVNYNFTRFIQRPQCSREYIKGDELLFGDWMPGRYAWELANVKMLPEPVPAKGKQRFWTWESEIHEA